MTLFGRTGAFLRRLFFSLLLSAFLLVNGFGRTAEELRYRSDVIVTAAGEGNEIIIDVEGNHAVPYRVRITRDIFGFTMIRDGQTVLASTTGDASSAGDASSIGTASMASPTTTQTPAPQGTAAFSAVRGGAGVTAGPLLEDTFDGAQLTLRASASDGGAPFTITAIFGGDRVTWLASLPGAEQVTLSLDLASGGHWYGHGEGGNENGLWPLNDATTAIHAADFSPMSYDMVEPFWLTSKSTGLWVDTDGAMAVSIDGTTAGTGRADFTVKAADVLRAVTFIERAPRDVYFDYVGIAGKPVKSDAPDIQYTEPLWNTWAMYGITVTQADVVAYAQNIKSAGLGGYAIQIDDRWSSKYGDFTFDPEKFPDPEGMSEQIHALGFDLGLWVTLWINPDAANYAVARDAGYLLKSAANPSQPCVAKWWHGDAGIVDLGNPAAVAWFRDQLRALQRAYNVQGFKFDTRFFDPACAATGGLTMKDYQRLGAELAEEFDLQGVGIRVHWTGQQQYGFISRAVDAYPDFSPQGLARSVHHALSLSVVGYPFVVTDMVGGSAGGNPTDEVLVRWAQATVALPFWYGSTSPVGPFTITREYAPETTLLYRAALEQRRLLAPYIRKQARRAVAEGEPIIKPLFFNFPKEEATYTIADEWLLGDAVLAAPVMASAESRQIYLPAGTWYDVNTQTLLFGPQTIPDYPAPLSVLPLFIRVDDPDGKELVAAFK